MSYFAGLVRSAALAAMALPHLISIAHADAVSEGKYLVTVAGCTDCHTPGHLMGKPDLTRRLAGSDVGFEVPGLGVFYGPNLTSDKETGLGKWTSAQIATVLTTGKRPDGRILAGPMPWRTYATLQRRDINAIVAYLKSLPAITNKAPGPFGPADKPTSFVMKIVPPPAK